MVPPSSRLWLWLSCATGRRQNAGPCSRTNANVNEHQVFWTFFSVIGGGFYFEEFSSLKLLGGLGFALGVLVVRPATVCNTTRLTLLRLLDLPPNLPLPTVCSHARCVRPT